MPTNETLSVTENELERKVGRKAGDHSLIEMNMVDFLREYRLDFILEENPYIKLISLYENPRLHTSYVDANFQKCRVEMSSRLLNDTVERQKIGFIKAICYFISFEERGVARGPFYDKLVQRYLKVIKPKTAKTAPKTTVRVMNL